MAASRGADVTLARPGGAPPQLFRFDPRLKLMSTVDEGDGGRSVDRVKGAPETVMARVTRIGRRGERR